MGFKEDIRKFNENHKMNTVKIGGSNFNYILSVMERKRLYYLLEEVAYMKDFIGIYNCWRKSIR